MGKINLSNLKSHIESASDSFKKLQPENTVKMRVVGNKNIDSMESLLNNTHEMLRNIPSLSKVG